MKKIFDVKDKGGNEYRVFNTKDGKELGALLHIHKVIVDSDNAEAEVCFYVGDMGGMPICISGDVLSMSIKCKFVVKIDSKIYVTIE